MKKFSSIFDYSIVLKYLSILVAFIIFNNLEKNVMPYSISFYCATIALNCNLFITPILLELSFLIQGQTGFLAPVAIACIFMLIVKLVHNKLRVKNDYTFLAFTIISLIGFILIGNTNYQIILEKRIFCSIITFILTYFSYISIKVISNKGLKYKLSKDEIFSIALIVVVVSLGICNVLSPLVWKTISVTIILLSCYLFRFGIGSIISAILSIGIAIEGNNIGYIAWFLMLGITAECFMEYSRYVSATAIIVSDYFLQIIFRLYLDYTTEQFLSIFVGAVIFCIVPTSVLRKIKEKLYAFREKQLSRQSINRNRIMLANRLYELSGIFSEMSQTFITFSQQTLSEEKAKNTICKNVIANTCENCNEYSKCRKNEKQLKNSFFKLCEIGFAKGKLSLIDLPKEVIDNCVHAGELIYGFNKLLSDYRLDSIENQNLATGRQIIAQETAGVSEILRGLALESGTLLKYQSRLERKLNEILLKNGFYVTELLIYGEEEQTSVGIIVAMEEFSIKSIQILISKVLGFNMVLDEKNNVTQDKVYLLFKRSAPYDAVFGISKRTKDNVTVSGDTYSATRINKDKFLVALSDGMGSGNKAENVSSASLSLIESFYKAGMQSNLILETVNQLLSINTEDIYTALDVSVIDLKTCSVDFIKYGSPYSFIINEGGVRIVEGNSLPLGILSELKPSVCSTNLQNGDMILLISDGISDAFGSSSEIIDLLRKCPALNPQSLTDEIMNKALELSNGKSNDDMTAVAVRIFKKSDEIA